MLEQKRADENASRLAEEQARVTALFLFRLLYVA